MAGILVLSGNSTVGAGAVRELMGMGVQVRAGVRNLARAGSLADAGVDIVEADLERQETLEAALRGVESVLLSTAIDPRVGEMHARLYPLAVSAGVRRMVRVSVVGAGADSPLSFARYHAAGDRALMESGLEWTILRPQSFAQNFFASAGTIRAEGRIYGCAGNGRVPHIDARDISRVAAVALTQPGHAGRAYDLTGPAAVSMEEAAGIFSAVLGRRVEYVRIPAEAMRQGLLSAGLPGWLVEGLVWLQENAYADGAAMPVSGAVEEIAGQPATPFEQFVRDHAGAFGG